MKTHLEARIDRISSAERQLIRTSYHGIAARLDRLPSGIWHRKIMLLFGGVVFCDCLDMYVGGGILAQLLQSGWSTVDLNAVFASITMLGYLLGALLSGYSADRFGRRKSLLISTMLFSIATLLAAFSPNMVVLIVMRGIMGLGLGGALPNSYGALSEYTPPIVRGRYAGWVGMIGNFSPPLGALLTVLVIPIFGWQAIFVGISLISFLSWYTIWRFLPESPRWLASKGRYEEADEIVTQAERTFLQQGIELPEIDYEKLSEPTQQEVLKEVGWNALFKKQLIKRTIAISAALFAMNLMVYTITNWTPTIFVLRGMDTTMSIGITVVMLIGAPFGIFLLSLFADKHDRKKGLIVCLLLLAICAYLWSLIPTSNIFALMAVGFVLCSILYYYSLLACSVYLGEEFPTEIRMRGSGFAHAVGRLAGIISPYIIAFLLQSYGAPAVFLTNGLILVIAAIIIGICGEETRGRSLEEINDNILVEDS
jgi:putative MFS transporter